MIDIQATVFIEANDDDEADAILQDLVAHSKEFPERPIVQVREVARWEVEA